MRRPGYDGAFWPGPTQEALLRAATLDPAAGARVWRELRRRLVLDDLRDEESHRLLPLVYRNLRAAGVEDPDLGRLKGLYRRTWYENQIRLHGITPVLTALGASGVETLLLKGVPLALDYYRDLGARPMADVDVLVPYERLDAALDFLEAEGWRDLGLHVTRERRRRSYHGAAMTHPDGRALDVHWHLALPFVLPGVEAESSDDFWAAAVPVTVGGVAMRALAPTDLLLHVVVHGAWSGSSATFRWAADASVLLRAAADRIEWARLLDQTVRRRLVLPVRNGLRYVADVLRAPVPGSVLSALEAEPVTRRERRSYAVAAADGSARAMLGGLVGTRAYWARQSANWGRLRAARELPQFLQENWNLAHPGQVPVEVLRKAARRLRRLGDGVGRPRPERG